ncbi:MAG: hypothetical protein R3C14_33915 [Caldilineaceae bacterium]
MTIQQIIFEMETADPDDFMTLLWLADHPVLDLTGVVITPGSADQCRLVRWGLDRCGRTDVPLGALHGSAWWATVAGQKARVSSFHYKAYGTAIQQHPIGEVAHGPTLLAELLQKRAATVLVGAPPKNIGQTLQTFPAVKLTRWVQQGGFAGDNLVAQPLPKFKGRITCPSFNPGGAWRETLALLASPQIDRRLFVSKNVCHGVVWTRAMGDALKQRLADRGVAPRMGMTLLVEALDHHLGNKATGKALHDLVAATCVLDEGVCEFAEVEIYRGIDRERGEWGARAAANTKTWITVGFDEARFLAVLAQ